MSTLPRMSTTSRSGRTDRSCAARRGDPVPTRAPRRSVVMVRPPRAHRTSRGFSRSGVTTVSPGAGSVGRSLRECTATAHRPSSSASRSAVTKTPVPPIWASEPVSTSPSVRMRTISTSRSVSSSRRRATWPVWVVARALPRVPTRRGVVPAGLTEPVSPHFGIPRKCARHGAGMARGVTWS
ncbi:Uncharacterised protein [Mycobacteroides abscessus]|nr:Uncharacterised protein [Mycobacteroides abscessus]